MFQCEHMCVWQTLILEAVMFTCSFQLSSLQTLFTHFLSVFSSVCMPCFSCTLLSLHLASVTFVIAIPTSLFICENIFACVYKYSSISFTCMQIHFRDLHFWLFTMAGMSKYYNNSGSGDNSGDSGSSMDTCGKKYPICIYYGTSTKQVHERWRKKRVWENIVPLNKTLQFQSYVTSKVDHRHKISRTLCVLQNLVHNMLEHGSIHIWQVVIWEIEGEGALGISAPLINWVIVAL